jgi:hypothetical protein
LLLNTLSWLDRIRSKTIDISRSANVFQTIRLMVNVSKEAASHPQIQALAAELRRGTVADSLAAIISWVHSAVVYRAHPDGFQWVRSPLRTLDDGVGNCVDYSVLIGSILGAMGYDYSFRLVGYRSPFEYDHVFVVVDGIAVDPVATQRQDGTDTVYNRKDPVLGYTIPYLHSLDI